MSVEFAVALPVVAFVLVSLVAAVLVVDGIGRLQLAASTAARAVGRGDAAGGTAAADRIAPGATVRVHDGGAVVCVEVSRAGSGPFAVVPMRATGCAAARGR